MKTIQLRFLLGLIGILAFGMVQVHAQNLPNIKKVTDPIKNAGKTVTEPIRDVRSTTKEITQPIKDVSTATRDVTQPVRETKREVEGMKNDVRQVNQDVNRAKSDIERAKDQVTPNGNRSKDDKDKDKDEEEKAKAGEAQAPSQADEQAAEKARADSVYKSKLRKNVYVAEEETPEPREAAGASTGGSRTVLLPPDNNSRSTPLPDYSTRGVVEPSTASADTRGYMSSPARQSIDKVDFDIETLKDLFEAAIWTGPDSVHTARSIGYMLDELRRDINDVRRKDPNWDTGLYEDRYRKWRALYNMNTRRDDEI